MIEYIQANSPDFRILKRAKEHLQKGELVCFPSDTSWVVLADPFQSQAVQKLYEFKDVHHHHPFGLFVPDISTASEIAVIPDYAYRWLKRAIPGSYTFIFEARKKIVKALKSSKQLKEVGVRVTPARPLKDFVELWEGPLLSTNVTPELVNVESEDQIYGLLIDEAFHQVALVVDPGEEAILGPSTIYNFSGEEPELVREGQGEALF